MKLFLWQTFKVISLLFFLYFGIECYRSERSLTFDGILMRVFTLVMSLLLAFSGWVLLILLLHIYSTVLPLDKLPYFLKYIWRI